MTCKLDFRADANRGGMDAHIMTHAAAASMSGSGDPFPDLDDTALAVRCAQGDNEAERVLLARHMQAIYWLPRNAFGAPEECLADFLLYAVEKIRDRDILSKFDPAKGAQFGTWFGVVIRRLYLDYLRANPPPPLHAPLHEEQVESPPESPPDDQADPALLDHMQVRCRVLFKLLLCNTMFLQAEEVQWIARESGKRIVDVMHEIALLEADLREHEVALAERYDKLATAFYWKSAYEQRIAMMERTREHPHTDADPALEEERGKLQRRNREYLRLVHELSGSAGIATAPYRDLASLLAMREGTLASHISRCRAAAADYLLKARHEP